MKRAVKTPEWVYDAKAKRRKELEAHVLDCKVKQYEAIKKKVEDNPGYYSIIKDAASRLFRADLGTLLAQMTELVGAFLIPISLVIDYGIAATADYSQIPCAAVGTGVAPLVFLTGYYANQKCKSVLENQDLRNKAGEYETLKWGEDTKQPNLTERLKEFLR
jgi:hypothetical protein